MPRWPQRPESEITEGKNALEQQKRVAFGGGRMPSPPLAVLQGTALEEQIVIGTPGTMLDWCFKRRVIDVKKISMFVLDEADIMIDTQGLSYQSIRIQR